MKIANLPQKLITYLKEVYLETKKVSWPTRQQTLNYTLIVIALSTAVAIFLGTVDFIFTTLLNKFVF
ncbi:preprotein translocase subunit SecE [Patescibacteria group bacterium]|nr:preprotein translocase subunit SecE [Patescibacteria group bacterium]